MNRIQPIILNDKFALIHDYWNPRIAGEVGDQYLKLAKFTGEFGWHHHKHEDELFLVVRGQMRMGLRDPDERELTVSQGEVLIVPREVEHRPAAVGDETWIVMLEPKTTLNTGTERNEYTRAELDWI
ncbi:cupin domain-containing protein [Deinococcus sp.]|uniref:cupin domain-containing protein n=1 Tax=Deinococcus sp. TaxID=47478 RepID=UPI003C7E305F